MILRDFISKSLLDIVGALNDVEKQSPGTVITNFTKSPDFIKMGVTEIQSVEFEVLVRADERAGTEANLNVVAATVGGNVVGESGEAVGHSATLRFRVPFNLATVGSAR